MRPFQTLALVVALCCSGPALADQASEAAAARLLDAMDAATTLQRVITVTLDGEIAQKPELAPYRGVLQAFFDKYMGYAALKPKMVAIYAAEFSARELDEAAAFYATPTGRKLLDKLPVLMAKGGELGQQSVQAHLPELQAAIQAEAARIKALQDGGATDATPAPDAAGHAPG